MRCAWAIQHWDGGPERNRNAALNCEHAYRMARELQHYGLAIFVYVFDFSPEPLITGPNVTHIPHQMAFGKSAKCNEIIRRVLSTPTDVLALCDSDTLVAEEDWPRLLQLVAGFQPGVFCNFNMLELTEEAVDELRQRVVISASRGLAPHNLTAPECCGLVLAEPQALADVGGFDERFTHWGLEDNDLFRRLCRSGVRPLLANFPVYHLPHPLDPTQQAKSFTWQQRLLYEESIIRNGGPLTKCDWPEGSDD